MLASHRLDLLPAPSAGALPALAAQRLAQRDCGPGVPLGTLIANLSGGLT